MISLNLSATNNSIVLEVIEEGPELSGEQLPLVYNRFYRGNDQREISSGLGLSTCKQITNIHHAEIILKKRENINQPELSTLNTHIVGEFIGEYNEARISTILLFLALSQGTYIFFMQYSSNHLFI